MNPPKAFPIALILVAASLALSSCGYFKAKEEERAADHLKRILGRVPTSGTKLNNDGTEEFKIYLSDFDWDITRTTSVRHPIQATIEFSESIHAKDGLQKVRYRLLLGYDDIRQGDSSLAWDKILGISTKVLHPQAQSLWKEQPVGRDDPLYYRINELFFTPYNDEQRLEALTRRILYPDPLY